MKNEIQILREDSVYLTEEDLLELVQKHLASFGWEAGTETKAVWNVKGEHAIHGLSLRSLSQFSLEPFGSKENAFPHRENLLGEMKLIPAGEFEMHGNVWEWCSDWYDHDYYRECQKKGIVSDPQGPDIGSYRVHRGGSWGGIAVHCRSAYRNFVSPDIRSDYLGFRLVRTVGRP